MARGTEGIGLEQFLMSLSECNANYKSGSRHVKMHLTKPDPKKKGKGAKAKAKASAAGV